MTIQQGPPTKDFLTDVDVLVRERDELRQKLEEMTQICHRLRNLANRDNARALEAERKRDQERARADVAEATLAKVNVDALVMADRVKHLAWVASGSPMLGEEPST